MSAETGRRLKATVLTWLNPLLCTRPWLWLERQTGWEPFRTVLLSPIQRANYLSYGEAKQTPGCRCRPSNVLYWELSEANTQRLPGSRVRRGGRMTLPTLVRCVVCHTEWEMSFEPAACTCQGPNGGWWQMSVDGGVWIDQNPLDNDGSPDGDG